MLAPGVTVTAAPTKLPGFQVYVAAPLAVKTAVCPTQIEALLVDAVTVGLGVTLI